MFWSGFDDKRQRITLIISICVCCGRMVLDTERCDNFSSILTDRSFHCDKMGTIDAFIFSFLTLQIEDVTRCLLFPYSPDGWSRKGCHAVKSTSNAEETKCSCNHMTHLAVLFHDSDGNSKVKCTLPLGSIGCWGNLQCVQEITIARSELNLILT